MISGVIIAVAFFVLGTIFGPKVLEKIKAKKNV